MPTTQPNPHAEKGGTQHNPHAPARHAVHVPLRASRTYFRCHAGRTQQTDQTGPVQGVSLHSVQVQYHQVIMVTKQAPDEKHGNENKITVHIAASVT